MPANPRGIRAAILAGAVLCCCVGPGAIVAQAASASCSPPAAESESNLGLQPLQPALVPQQPWAQQRLSPRRVWPLTTGAGVRVAVIDTGVDATNPQLSAPGLVLEGDDVVQGGPANDDCVGHGTMVAGIIAAQPLPGVGMAGVAPGVQLLPVRQSESDQQTNGAETLATAINSAVANGASVINISITTSGSDSDLAGAVSNALDRNVVVVAAAGNDGSGPNSPTLYPASYPGVLSVGAVGQNGQLLSFSSTGRVSVVAPGEGIVGPAAGGQGQLVGQGTSFATAFVTGVAALVRSYLPGLTAEQVVQRIEATADHQPSALPSLGLGWGEVDPYAAVTAVLPSSGPTAAARQAALAAPRPSRATGGDEGLAMVIAIASVGCALLVVAVAALSPYGRRRGWRPGSWHHPGGSQVAS
jgi:type VII secretion-associated serine protease mycosin